MAREVGRLLHIIGSLRVASLSTLTTGEGVGCHGISRCLSPEVVRADTRGRFKKHHQRPLVLGLVVTALLHLMALHRRQQNQGP